MQVKMFGTHLLFVSNQTFVNHQFICSYKFRKTPNYTVHNVAILFTRAEDITTLSHTETTGSTTAEDPQEAVHTHLQSCGFLCRVIVLLLRRYK